MVWQLAMALSEEVYRLIRTTSARRDFSFRDQLTEAVSGIASNIADGFPRGALDFGRLVTYSRACLTETESWLEDGVLRGHWRSADISNAKVLVRRLTPALRELVSYLQSPEAQRRSRLFRMRQADARSLAPPPAPPSAQIASAEPAEPEEPGNLFRS
jgi:four helix bundle protein